MPSPDAFLADGTVIAADDAFAAEEPTAVPDCSMITQELTKWCWAAVTQTIEGTRGNVVEQCEVAQSAVAPDCCADKLSCNVERSLPEVLASRQIPCSPQGGTVSFAAIKAQIDAGKPVGCFIKFPAINHLVLISGYLADEQLQILDPAYDDPMPPREQSFESIRAVYRDDGSWRNTYFV